MRNFSARSEKLHVKAITKLSSLFRTRPTLLDTSLKWYNRYSIKYVYINDQRYELSRLSHRRLSVRLYN